MLQPEEEVRKSMNDLSGVQKELEGKAAETLLELSEYLKENAHNDEYCKVYKTVLKKLDNFRHWIELSQRAGGESDLLKWVLDEV